MDTCGGTPGKTPQARPRHDDAVGIDFAGDERLSQAVSRFDNDPPPIAPDWPVTVSWAEAAAYARNVGRAHVPAEAG